MDICELKLRLPIDLKAWLKVRARANHRTINGELVALLENTQRGRFNQERTGTVMHHLPSAEETPNA